MKKTLFSILAVASAMAASAQINDPSFEAGIGGGVWLEYSSQFGTPLCDATCGTTAYDGTYYAWFGGAPVDSSEVGVLEQTITIPTGNSATLTFWMQIAAGNAVPTDFIGIFFDSDSIPFWFATTADAPNYTAYTQVSVDVTSLADGGSHLLDVASSSIGGASFIVDAFDLVVDGGSVDVFNNQMNQEKAIAVFPSPANEQINVQFNGMLKGNATVKIFDVTGNLVSQDFVTEISNKVFTYNVSALPNGVYMMDVNNNGTVQTQRFVVAH
jgi:hypothetical protein